MRNIRYEYEISERGILEVSCSRYASGRARGAGELFRATWGDVRGDSGASGSFAEAGGVLVVSRFQDQREVGAFGDDGVVQRVSCDDNQGGHDLDEPVDAEGEDLFCVP